jgi:prepilin-type N-terminal cleavage/methylation domain-containing protein
MIIGRKNRLARRGFTLLEICVVMFIMLIMLGALTPALHSAFEEEATRADARELALMVRAAMLNGVNEHRAYVLEVTTKNLSLHPLGPAADGGENEAMTATHQLDPSNRILLPDPEKPAAWLPVKEATWTFQPGELCPAPRVRIARGSDWIEFGFNALTGEVDHESSYFP